MSVYIYMYLHMHNILYIFIHIYTPFSLLPSLPLPCQDTVRKHIHKPGSQISTDIKSFSTFDPISQNCEKYMSVV